MIEGSLLEILACPACGHSLEMDGDALVCAECLVPYMVVEGIPLLIPNSAEPTHKGWEGLASENSVLRIMPFRSK